MTSQCVQPVVCWPPDVLRYSWQLCGPCLWPFSSCPSLRGTSSLQGLRMVNMRSWKGRTMTLSSSLNRPPLFPHCSLPYYPQLHLHPLHNTCLQYGRTGHCFVLEGRGITQAWQCITTCSSKCPASLSLWQLCCSLTPGSYRLSTSASALTWWGVPVQRTPPAGYAAGGRGRRT